MIRLPRRPLPGSAQPARLHTRVALVLAGLALVLAMSLAALWLYATRQAITEELDATGRVSEQMLRLLTLRVASSDELVAVVRPLGRVRAHELVVLDGAGEVRYHSPAPAYKAGRSAPEWFGALLDPQLPVRNIQVGALRLRLEPDASRSLLDAWDQLRWLGLGLGAFLAVLCLLVRQALLGALRPLDQVLAALDSMGLGHFETRLPIFPTSELSRLARAFNGMADRLKLAVDENVRLETERELSARLQQRLDAERRDIAHELHDELAQGVTAVRALAGAIVQRTAGHPEIRAQAGYVVEAAGEMQLGVRRILNRLHTPAVDADQALAEMLERWRQHHPEIRLDCRCRLRLADCPDELAGTLLRAVQEGLTNVVRHAAARYVDLELVVRDGALQLRLTDDGRGCASRENAGCGLGLAGMRERVERLGGVLSAAVLPAGGFELNIRLPGRIEEKCR